MKGWLAADIGGTKLSAAAFDGNRLFAHKQIDTNPEAGVENVAERLAGILEQAAFEAHMDPIGLGIACPGPLSATRGVVEFAPMLGWHDVPIRQMLSNRLGISAVLENDANAAALGEQRFGAGVGCHSMAYITISTGVGCGIVLNGRIWTGQHEAAGELGHLMIDPNGMQCACGRRGCLEMYASGTAIGREAKRIAVSQGLDAGTMDAKMASQLLRAGDEAYRAVFEKAGAALGRGIAALLQLLDLERIVIGGSVSASMDLLRSSIMKNVIAGSYWADEPENWLHIAKLQPDSGLYGAACIAAENFRTHKGGTSA